MFYMGQDNYLSLLLNFINNMGGKSTQLPQTMNGVYDIGFWMCRVQSLSKSIHVYDQRLHPVFNILHIWTLLFYPSLLFNLSCFPLIRCSSYLHLLSTLPDVVVLFAVKK